MSLIPLWYSASTKAVAEKALERGVLKYPAMCYIAETQGLAWITIENKIHYINGDNQITDIKYLEGKLIFFSGEKILYSYDVLMSEKDAEMIVKKVTTSLNMDQYITTPKMAQMLDDIIGNLGDKKTVIDYVNSLSYDKLTDVPIVNMKSELYQPVYISSLSDGVYKIQGQYVIGGNNQTIHSSSDDLFFIVSKQTSLVTITQIQSNFIKIFFIDNLGNCATDRYVTEKWVSEQHFINAAELAVYVKQNVEKVISEILDVKLDEKLDTALDVKLIEKISEIPKEQLYALFIK